MVQTSEIKNVPGLSKESKLVIFVCGTVPPKVLKSIGGYHELYVTMFEHSIKHYGGNKPGAGLLVKSYTLFEDDFPSEEELLGTEFFLISGSKFNAYDSDPWILRAVDAVRTIHDKNTKAKLFGICFGHQLIARAFGGKVGPSNRWELGSYVSNLSDKGQQIFGKEQLAIQQMHRDIVQENPTGFDVYAWSDAVPNHGMIQWFKEGSTALENIRVITIQGHPEFSAQTVQDLVEFRHGAGVLNDEDARKGLELAHAKADTDLFGYTLLRIIAADVD